LHQLYCLLRGETRLWGGRRDCRDLLLALDLRLLIGLLLRGQFGRGLVAGDFVGKGFLGGLLVGDRLGDGGLRILSPLLGGGCFRLLDLLGLLGGQTSILRDLGGGCRFVLLGLFRSVGREPGLLVLGLASFVRCCRTRLLRRNPVELGLCQIGVKPARVTIEKGRPDIRLPS
jgi:hypothetical protein